MGLGNQKLVLVGIHFSITHEISNMNLGRKEARESIMHHSTEYTTEFFSWGGRDPLRIPPPPPGEFKKYTGIPAGFFIWHQVVMCGPRMGLSVKRVRAFQYFCDEDFMFGGGYPPLLYEIIIWKCMK